MKVYDLDTALIALAEEWRARALREDEEGERYEDDASQLRLRLCAEELERTHKEWRK